MDYKPGADIFGTDADMIVNPVNCVGAMGKGLALAFKKKYPAILEPYTNACKAGQMKPGSVQLIRINKETGERVRGESTGPEVIVANVATKDDWRDPSQLSWVDTGLQKLAGAAEVKGVKSVAIPMLGSGLGGLDWKDVGQSVEKHFRPLSERGVKIVVLGEPPEHQMISAPASKGSIKVPEGYGEGETYYAGIGARDTPPVVLRKMEDVGEILAKRGYTLRSGAAKGADSAFEAGADRAQGKKEIFLPWEGFKPVKDGPIERFSDGVSVFSEESPQHRDLAQKYHPNFEKLGRGGKSLMARNGSQMLGRDLTVPSKLVVCWTKGGGIVGGTGQALRMAQDCGAQVLNMGDPRISSLSADKIADMATQVLEGHAKADDLINEAGEARKKAKARLMGEAR
jgi:O-acetyl-ADP-ribose deacetylase (regulator of RNase III)